MVHSFGTQEELACREICRLLTVSEMQPGLNTSSDCLMLIKDPHESSWLIGWDEHEGRWVIGRFIPGEDPCAWYWSIKHTDWLSCSVQGW